MGIRGKHSLLEAQVQIHSSYHNLFQKSEIIVLSLKLCVYHHNPQDSKVRRHLVVLDYDPNDTHR